LRTGSHAAGYRKHSAWHIVTCRKYWLRWALKGPKESGAPYKMETLAVESKWWKISRKTLQPDLV
jgi:hypothetical protein